MESLHVDFSHCCIAAPTVDPILQRLKPHIEQVQQAIKQGYTTEYACLHLPEDEALLQQITALANRKKSLEIATLLVVGIGGSNLGAMAIEQALHGLLYNQITTGVKVYYAETVDPDYMHDILTLCKKDLDAGKKILINVISKSGSTLETIVNFQLLLDLLQTYHPHDYQKYVVVTTDEHSPLHAYASKNTFDYLLVPRSVGGRYSVFSAVGLFPLAMLDVDIHQLQRGAKLAIAQETNLDVANNDAAKMAALLYIYYLQGYIIHNFFVFAVSLETLGKWFRQLVGESLGKACNRQNQTVHVGIMPTVAIGTTDLHSVGQLYLAGPYNHSTLFISMQHYNNVVNIPDNVDLASIIGPMHGKSLSFIMHAISQGTQKAFALQQRPFVTLTLPNKNIYSIGQLMQTLMLQIMYTGYLLDINPFDQPQVELYKTQTRKILSDG